MNHLEKTFWDMENRCIFFLEEKKSVWEENNIIKEDVDALYANKKEIENALKMQGESDTSGLVAQKKQDIQAVSKEVYRIGRSLTHLAKKTNDQVLWKIAGHSESALISGEEREMFLRFRRILSAAREKLPLLEPYKITKERIDQVEGRIIKVEEMPDNIDMISNSRKGATRTIKELIAEARLILDRLDDAIEGMISDEKFLDDWFEARKIKGRHRRKNHDMDEENNEE